MTENAHITFDATTGVITITHDCGHTQVAVPVRYDPKREEGAYGDDAWHCHKCGEMLNYA